MHINSKKFLDTTLAAYIMAIWIGILTLSVPFLLLAAGIITAYGLGRAGTYQHAQDDLERYP